MYSSYKRNYPESLSDEPFGTTDDQLSARLHSKQHNIDCAPEAALHTNTKHHLSESTNTKNCRHFSQSDITRSQVDFVNNLISDQSPTISHFSRRSIVTGMRCSWALLMICIIDMYFRIKVFSMFQFDFWFYLNFIVLLFGDLVRWLQVRLVICQSVGLLSNNARSVCLFIATQII